MHPIRASIKPLNSSRFHILFPLAECGPAATDAIEGQITADAMGSLYIKPSTFYRLLSELAEHGWITTQPYQLTNTGRVILQREIKYYQRVAQLAPGRLR